MPRNVSNAVSVAIVIPQGRHVANVRGLKTVLPASTGAKTDTFAVTL
jgi:hypothetical protein